MKKRIWSILLALCMVLTLLPFGASAADIVDSGACGDNLTWTLDSNGKLTISGTGEMTNYTFSFIEANKAFLGESISKVRSVVIEPGVTSIGSSAFSGFRNLTEITIPDSVTSIGAYAFYGCSSLTSVTIPDGVTGIWEFTFCSCSSLTSVTIPGSVKTIGQNAFGSNNLTSITIPDGVTSIDGLAFNNCSSLTSIEVNAGNLSFRSIDGVMFSKDAKTIICCPPGRSGDYQIPQGVTSIGECAFMKCSRLTSVTIPDSVTSIDVWAFYNCTGLTSVTIPNRVTSIGAEAFFDCSSLVSVTIPDSVTSIGGGAFSDCSSLMSVTIPDSVTSIGGRVFSDCSSLVSVTIPTGVTRIGEGAFSDCSSLVSVTIPDSVTSVDRGAFYNCSSLASVTIPDSVVVIGVNAFEGCTSLKKVIVPGSVQEFGHTTYTYADGEGVVDFRGAVFASCTGLETVIIEDGVTRIELATFESCSSLADVTIPASVTSIGDWAFNGCSSLKDIWYSGTQAQWETVFIGESNDPLFNAEIHFNATGPDEPTPTTPPVTSFTDVAANAYYAEPVSWAVKHTPQITNGTSATTFSPDADCTRGQIVTFLWRAKGCPEPQSTVNPFEDVKDSDYFFKAVLWAVENGITNGMDTTHFGPNASCTRAQAVTFLWRAENKPAAKTQKSDFTDVQDASVYFYTPVLWAVENGITNGTSATSFSPDATCTRGQIVTFLYRDLAK